MGDIYDWKTGCKAAGLLTEDKKSFRRTEDLMYASTEVVENKFTGNTTIGIIVTNAGFTKPSLCKIAGMAHDGYADRSGRFTPLPMATASMLFLWEMWQQIRI